MELLPYLKVMVDKGGSDLFLSVGARPNVKVEGKTIAIGSEPVSADAMRHMAYSLLSKDEVREFESQHELNIGYHHDVLGRFRINLFLSRGDISMVFRYIKDSVPAITELGLPDVIRDLVLEKRGLILVVGATGSGKSTTMASMIDHRNSSVSGHILTIEDPIEFLHAHKLSVVDQREVGSDTNSYETALVNALRESPDLIVIGEIRDAVVMQRALQFAETGHLCLATLHASNSSQALERIINFFPEAENRRLLQDLSSHLKAIISQRLIRGVEDKRLAAVEIMLNTSHIADLVSQGKIKDIREAMEKQVQDRVPGVVTFDQSILGLWREEKISAAEAIKHADSQHNVHMTMELEKPGSLDADSEVDLTIQS